MARIKGKATITEDGYKDLHCIFCGSFQNKKIYLGSRMNYFVCKKCKTKMEIRLIQKTSDVFLVDMCMWTAT